MQELRISWSSLRTHEECKQKGFLQRTGHRASLDNQRVFFPGNVTDRVVRAWLMDNPQANPGDMPKMVESIMDGEREKILAKGQVMTYKDLNDREQILKDCTEAVTKIEPALQKYVVPYKFTADFSFKSPLQLPHPSGGTGPVFLNGYMDILVQDDKDRFWVWDVKHTRDDSYWRKTVGQLTFYDWAVFCLYGQTTVARGLLQPLCKKQVLPVAIGEDQRQQMMQRIGAFARDTWLDDHAPNRDSKACGFCSVKHSCEKFKSVVVNGRRTVSF